MGAWGYKALESDEGLDVVDFIRDYAETKYPGNVQIDLKLSEVINALKEADFFGKTWAEIDFFYDHSAMALAELYLMFKETGELDYPDEENETRDLKKRIQSFTGDTASFDFLLGYLTDIKNGVPDEDGEREIVELWKDSDVYNEWEENLTGLIAGLKAENN
ncbi:MULTISPECIES: DUF4259 domain-containing protein [Chryseobacterium]|uniref:DUF4259 domain-containing protein n=1 Tax=Chryseobacterium TaxID=59732 RepID=UPI001295E62A|nr:MULTISPECIES: DUF4259 domain-containing protein [Chryseobacterium]MDR6923378.1 hypothetical protein [Chryseobacterium sp. 2987]